MKYKFLLLFLCTSLFINANNTPRWGATGHRVVGEIATKHLTKRTKRKLKKLLKGQSLAFASTYADEIRSDERYRKFSSWHYANLHLDETYEASDKNSNGDIITAIAYCKTVITDENSSQDDKAFYLKLLIHFIGDMHQPMHAGLAEDRGGNDFKVQWFGNDSNLHRVWDSEMIDQYDMSYLELAKNDDALSKTQIKEIQQGSVVDWFNDTHVLTTDVYKNTKEGDNLRYRYSYTYFNTVRKQLQIAGIRLAKVLNDIL